MKGPGAIWSDEAQGFERRLSEFNRVIASTAVPAGSASIWERCRRQIVWDSRNLFPNQPETELKPSHIDS